jgi:hypothetical protein
MWYQVIHRNSDDGFQCLKSSLLGVILSSANREKLGEERSGNKGCAKNCLIGKAIWACALLW